MKILSKISKAVCSSFYLQHSEMLQYKMRNLRTQRFICPPLSKVVTSMRSFFVLCLVAISISAIHAQRDGRYRPNRITTTRKPLYPMLGRYNVNQNYGRYNSNNGNGKFRINADEKYRPQVPVRPAKGGRSNFRNNQAPSPSPAITPSTGGDEIQILYLLNEQENDNYHYVYQTDNGIMAEEEGRIEELSTGDGLRAKGFFEYTGDDGVQYRVDYTADDAGFVPQGAHLPPTPPHVVKLLEYLALNAKK